jgi:hypothetical protein
VVIEELYTGAGLLSVPASECLSYGILYMAQDSRSGTSSYLRTLATKSDTSAMRIPGLSRSAANIPTWVRGRAIRTWRYPKGKAPTTVRKHVKAGLLRAESSGTQ